MIDVTKYMFSNDYAKILKDIAREYDEKHAIKILNMLRDVYFFGYKEGQDEGYLLMNHSQRKLKLYQ